ncbi:hypothetical protein VOLCADRAFT_67382 [Volvox carteri f. nagariensis]|uniref:Uncharacterized protein n=1 Tax=Volvox carteri f. nagariensis TaxID=3068 RepID=D8UDK0_VOLCA|nr:uncharacterized protein VOLCADRAFT_67382 [Volvox carteri f. nagariensis]EFJ42207.1 hypothetical protein VOLCADRAFT_67382 [Volvox carteri f. nagariensis]|eukprot:XP_002956750.1 hypothetical protein VOLCADRAFT_67382 [Volvox carteri f. nagariensis]
MYHLATGGYPPVHVPPCHRRIPSCTCPTLSLPPEDTLLYHLATREYPPVPPCHRRVPSCTTLPPESTLLYHPATR